MNVLEHPVPVGLALVGAAALLFGLAALVQLADDAHDVEPDPPDGRL